MRKLERGKAAGPDGLLNEMMSFGGQEMIKFMTALFNTLAVLEVYTRNGAGA